MLGIMSNKPSSLAQREAEAAIKVSHVVSEIWGWVKTLVPSEPQNSW